MLSGEEIRNALKAFVKRWQGYSGGERGEAQTFLNELLACYGVDRKEVGVLFEDAHTADGIMDMHWPGVCIVEMKAPSEADRLAAHRQQALDYWHTSDDFKKGRPAPRWAYRRYWWQFAEARREMRSALKGLELYIASVAQGKRLLLAWAEAWTCPSNLTYVFAFDDDYAMGVLSSSAHGAWAKSRSSTLEDRLRYTPSSVFETFAWPYPVDDDQRERIGKLSRDIIERRQAICAESDIGLTALYNLVDDGAYEDLKALHNRLDEEVVKAYGWPKAVAHDHDEMVRRLLELNRDGCGTRVRPLWRAGMGSGPSPRSELIPPALGQPGP